MADKRIRSTNTEKVKTVEKENKNIITPNENTPVADKQYDSVLQKLAELEAQNKELTKKVAEASWDISDKVKESKRKYWFNIDGSRNKEEQFKFRYNCLMDNGKEKVVISAETIWRPIHYQNSNTWKWVNEHNVKVVFHDNTSTKIDVLDYINQKFQYEDYVLDTDINSKDGIKHYTFNTDKFWTFTIKENFIN